MRILSFVLMLLLVCTKSMGADGHDVGNGGDSLVISIRRTASMIHAKLVNMKPECSAKLKLNGELFGKILTRVQIQTSEKPLYIRAGNEMVFKEAINYPQKQLIIFHRESYRTSDQKEQLIIHEFMGLAAIDDEDYTNSANIIYFAQMDSCQSAGPETPSEPSPGEQALPDGFVPLSTVIDTNGVAYLLDADNQKIYRYNVQSKRMLGALPTSYRPKKLVYAAQLNRLFVANDEGRVTFYDLTLANPKENGLVVVAGGLSDIIAVNYHLLVIPARGSGWVHYYTYDKSGRLVHEKDWSYPASHYAALEETGSVYYISNFSPADLHRLVIRNGQMITDGDSPYHGDYRLGGPIVPSTSLVAIGSGLVFESVSMKFVGSLPHGFDAGVWIDGHLLTASTKGGGFDLKFWNSNWFEQQTKRFEGALVTLLKFKGKAVLIYVGNDNKLKFEIPGLNSTTSELN
jgi:hypothetical protein